MRQVSGYFGEIHEFNPVRSCKSCFCFACCLFILLILPLAILPILLIVLCLEGFSSPFLNLLSDLSVSVVIVPSFNG
jgi:hypothetical protein